MAGTAPDGGLYVPVSLPRFAFAELPYQQSLAKFAAAVLEPFFVESDLLDELDAICTEAFSFTAPLRTISSGPEQLSVLELFHGPTAAFKDFGARFLAASMARIVASRPRTEAPATIIVATSGDTGGAVAAAFHQRPDMRVVVLFPEGRVSPRQQHQLTCWGDNVISLAVRGEFDDCQRIAKALFADKATSKKFNLCSANSINVGRLLPQSVYYAQCSSYWHDRHDADSNFVIPTGNLGNGFASAWAKSMGFPIDQLVLATNANRAIPDFLGSGVWAPRPSVTTLASAMDVGDPSNMERLRQYWGDAAELRQRLRAFSVTDGEIKAQIVAEFANHGIPWCPHTATAFSVYRHRLDAAERLAGHWVVVATAHPAKFETIVEPLVGVSVVVPEELSRLFALPARFETIEPQASEVIRRL